MNKSHRINITKKGFTLLEVVILMSVFSLIILVIGAFQRDVFSLNNILSSGISGLSEGRRALKVMTAEIRSSSPSSLGAYPIAEASSTSFTFFSDIDNDVLREQIRYFLDGTVLKKGVIKPQGDPLTYNPANESVTSSVFDIRNGAEPIFTYYDASYDGTTPPLPVPVVTTDIRLVKINLIIDRDPSRSPSPLSVTSQVTLRNLKDNL